MTKYLLLKHLIAWIVNGNRIIRLRLTRYTTIKYFFTNIDKLLLYMICKNIENDLFSLICLMVINLFSTCQKMCYHD